MISLRDILLLEDDVSGPEKEERSVWRTYFGRWGARNSLRQRRYFDSQEDATKFARGEIMGIRPGHPKAKKRADPKEKKQGYDYTPVRKVDSETRT